MFVSIRKYDGIPNPKAAIAVVEDKLVPAVRQMHGFHSYTTVDLGGGSILSISIFATQADTEAANAGARGLVQQYLVALVPNPPTVLVGEVLAIHTA